MKKPGGSGSGGLWIPVLVGLLLSIIVAFLWWTLNENEKNLLQNKVNDEADKMISYIDADLRGRIPAIQRIVMRWEERGGTPQREFESDIQSYISDLPGFQAIGWIDRDYIARWIVPATGKEQTFLLDLTSEKGLRAVLEAAGIKKVPTMTHAVSLPQGGLGFLVYFPIEVSGEFDGSILAVFRVQEWLDYVFTLNIPQVVASQFSFMVTMDKDTVYQSPEWISSGSLPYEASATIPVMNHRFSIILRPTRSFVENNSSVLPEIAAGVGVLLSLLISIVVFLYQKASKEILRTQFAASSLEQEIRKHKETEIKLNKASNRLELATKAGNIGVWSWNVESGDISWNRIMFDLYDIPPDVIPNYKTWCQTLWHEDLAATEDLLKSAIDGKAVFDTEFRITRAGNEIRNIRAAARVERDLTGKALRVTGVNWDITEAKRVEEKIQHMATHDALTGLPSLHLIKDRIINAVNLAKRHKKNMAVMFIDLDGFKAINDTYGHDAGDVLLQEVAVRLRSSLRETDTAGRIGGDEFLLVVQDISGRDDAELIAEKVIQSLSLPVFTGKGTMKVGASLGIAIYPEHGKDAESLIKEADKAMYGVKKSGKNNFALSGRTEDSSDS